MLKLCGYVLLAVYVIGILLMLRDIRKDRLP